MPKRRNKKLKIALGADHAGFPIKTLLQHVAEAEGYEVLDFGTDSDSASDYPDYASKVTRAIQSRKAHLGILACGSGTGMSISANKARGVRAAVCWLPKIASLAREHNNCNVLCLPTRFSSKDKIKRIVRAFLRTSFAGTGRHLRRVKKISRIESKF